MRVARLVTAGAVVSGCGEDTDTVLLRLTTHALPECAPPRGARLRLTALGDFPSAERTSEEVALAGVAELSVPAEARAFEATTEASGTRFVGYAERDPDGSARLLLWPDSRVCPLPAPPAYPALGGGQALGYSARTRSLLLAGGNTFEQPSATVGVLRFDTGTGAIATDDRAALREPRAFASVSAFGAQLLIAGGENPLHGEGDAAEPRASAEVFDPARGVFQSRVELVEPRSRHAALTLASGAVLLVGGRGAVSDALRVLETVDPVTRTASIAGLAALRAPRIAPSALVLDDGRLFVGGGTAADGTPLSALEWLSSDARTHLGERFPAELPARHDRAFTALPGGGVLLVGGCEAREPRDAAEHRACTTACRRGCPPLAGYDAWWIDPENQLHELEFELDAPRPVLLGGADGEPLLATGNPGDTVLFRFEPWRRQFVPLEVEVPAPPRAGLPAAGLDPESFVWLTETDGVVRLQGLRMGTRNRYARDVSLVARADPDDPARPLSLVPDRPLGDAAGYDGTLWFSAESTATVYVAATDYAGFTLHLEFEGRAPRLWLDGTELGGADCPWPAPASSPLAVRRSGSRVTLHAGAETRSCDGPSGRLRLGFRGAHGGETRLLRVELTRGG